MLWLVIAFLLSSLLPYVGCDLFTHRRGTSDLTDVTFNAVATSSSTGSKSSPTPPVKPVVNITAVFEEEDLDDFLPIFDNALAVIINDSKIFTWAGHVLSSSRDLKKMMTEMCAHFQGDKSQVRLIVVFGSVRTVQTVNLISQALGIPVIGYMLEKGDGYIQVHNPLFLSLQPSNKHLARGLVSLLSVNFWFRLTIITQTELRHDGFYNTFRDLTKNGKWKIEDEIFISKGASNAELNKSFEARLGNTSRIFVLHATASLTRRIFVTAKHLLPRQSRFAWIITENAYTRSEDILRDFPLGTKAFLVNHDVPKEELLRDALDFTMEAFQGDGNGRSALISRLIASQPSSSSFSLSLLSSSLASLHISSYSGKNKAYGCWSARSEVIQPHQDPVYSALISTSIYGLTGQIAFDEDGFMNISKFRVRNLVSDGRQAVWQDIGCVQGKEIRPFRIIWPGDAQNLKAETEGKKRYKVVTNPVQPFVMTEAPHSDYGQCVSDTPCLNVTNKFKSQEVVWRAIEAFENGNGSESGLFTVQCCRGLTIDLLKELSSDLEFEFTLYIVQDETYGQKVNGSWSGMMRDLTDNTAHFAVAAFSITSQRETAIDFTDPYFFSGFSVIYSDRTRETNMLAFLEPFSTKVWFAILVSAHITAVCMALLEWNSPFGLNPWGRKRNKNYSLASGLTMVFSVLFGHTVRAKSPKAWPSKFLQNIWAFAAIFIIASYTANLAAFIAGKHAGINYIDIQDTRLQTIRIGVLQGSAVHEFLLHAGSKLAKVAESFYVRKTDEGIDWVIRGKLDALLGDYPILDYARAHLAPSCELKLISKVFGVDRYGLGLPKESPLKAALSKKISEYHRIGYIDNLIDIHFADAHCIKKRISEEDSQLEVSHHAGLFVMLCVGFGVGVLVLLLEHLCYKFLVPFMRQCPEGSTWKSVHLTFVSQRLQRSITSAELVSPRHSANEMLGIFKRREFARLFQKSTIRRNRLADIAKTKRINRNFYDIVEKAKWLKEMKDSGLMDDDTLSTPSITEIPLKQLTVNVERGISTQKLVNAGATSVTLPPANYIASPTPAPAIYSSESSSPESDDSLLGGSRVVSDKSLPNSNKPGSPVLTLQALRASPSMSARRLRKNLRDQRYRHHRSHHTGMVSSPELDLGPNNLLLADDSSYSLSNKVRSLSADNTISPILSLDSPPNNIKHTSSSRSSLQTASVVNELSPTLRHHIPLTVDNSTASRVRFSDSLPNGNLVQRSADFDIGGHDSDIDTDSEDEDDDDEVCRQSIPNILSNPTFMLKANSDSTYNLACAGASASNYSNNSLLPKTSNISLARTLLYKSRSIQDQLCSAAESAQAEATMEPFCLDAVTKEELLVLWKTSEIELNKRLEVALREKARLERKLAMLQMHSPV